MFEYRVTKYDPAFRRSGGAYTRNEWTSYSDIGKDFDGVVLDEAEYRKVECAYVETALSFLRESETSALLVADLEKGRGATVSFVDGSSLKHDQIAEVVARVLREEFWCCLEGHRSFIHIGRDYYMYIGVPFACDRSVQFASQGGLFVEKFSSPYKQK